MSIYDIPLTTIDGQPTTLASYRGKVLLIVNVASECGFTPQYTGLELLHQVYRDRGFAVLGFPCDQFGHQEPGTEEEIKQFCLENYRISFPLFSKIEVNGPNTHPLYLHLKQEKPGVLGTESIKWNFTKFLVAADGEVLRRYAPKDTPERIGEDLRQLLG